jgi:RNA polymerase sigma-70 factor (ECF subfamily)
LAAWLEAVARSQDRDAFARLHRHFAPGVAAWMARAGLGPAQIEDIVQDCMVAVWRKASLYDPAHGGVSTWISPSRGTCASIIAAARPIAKCCR